MWKQQLAEIRSEKEDYDELLNEPATDEQMKKFVEEVKSKFNHVLPKAYIDFLKTVNGLEYNGFIIYGIDSSLSDVPSNQTINGYIENNKIWYENEHQKQYMFFGESSISWYCLDLSKGVFVELDNPSGTLMHTFDDFDSMLEKALKDSLL